MPTPLIDLQRRLTIVGAIRAGGEKQPKAPGRKLESFRLTSPRRQLLEQAASLYGGDVSKWQAPTGEEFQLYTEAEELPVLVMPGYSLRQTYELWEGATKRMRLCDGVEEELTGGPCICNAEGVDKCDLYTRLVVALPELDTVLGWRLISRGANAAHELPTIFALMEARGSGTFVPSKLRLDQRRGVKDGQVVRFVVPTLDLGVGYLALAAPATDDSRALPRGDDGFTAAPPRRSSVEEALASVDSPPEAINRRGHYTPLTPTGLDLGETKAIVPAEESAPPATATAVVEAPPPAPTASPLEPEPEEEVQTALATAAQKKKANVLVGRLREGGHIETRHLYDAVAKLRGLGGEELVLFVGGYDEDLVLHWAPLRDALTRPEANQLLDRLTALEERVKAAADTPAPAVTPTEEKPPEEGGPIPYGEFPPGY